MHFVYALFDPREPHIARYFGRTSVSLDKRLSDHISEARFIQRHKPFRFSDRYAWIMSLVNASVRPGIALIASFNDLKDCQEAERALISATFGTTHNTQKQANGGRPLGMKESEATLAKKRASWHSEYRAESLVRMPEAVRTHYRGRQGYPRPDLPSNAAENLPHYLELQKQGFYTRGGRLRAKMGYPRPDLPAFAPENIEHYRSRNPRYRGVTEQRRLRREQRLAAKMAG